MPKAEAGSARSVRSAQSARPQQTRARIAEAALDLFASQGYTDTTIDDIADAAAVGRRTVFRHFATKEAMVFDHLAVQREAALVRLMQRPRDEPPLLSLHAVLRELCEGGYDRELLAQIRTILATDPDLAGQQISLDVRVFERKVVDILRERGGHDLDSQILTVTAFGWFVTAVRVFLNDEERASLVGCFDEAVAVAIAANDHLGRMLAATRRRSPRRR